MAKGKEVIATGPKPPKTTPKKDKLNPKQELFCQLYATDREFFGNGVETYIEVYEPDTSRPNWYKTACSSASQILSNIKVCGRINELLEKEGFNDQNVDKQHLFLINQHADLKTKMSAIKEYNNLKKRVSSKSEGNTFNTVNLFVDEGKRDEAIKKFNQMITGKVR